MSTPVGPSGWFPDPTRRYEYRYHNGSQWTADVAVNGQRYVDPAGPPVWSPEWAAAAPGGRSPGRGTAVAAFVVGLISLLGAWIPFVFVVAAVGAVVALALGVSALRRQQAPGRGYAITGVVLGVCALLMCIPGFLLTRAVLREVGEFVKPGQHRVQITRCETEVAADDSLPANIQVLTPRLVTVQGTITNLEADTRTYSVMVEYTGSNGDTQADTVRVRDVPPGETAEFEANAFVVTGQGVDCAITDVFGPLPFADFDPSAG